MNPTYKAPNSKVGQMSWRAQPNRLTLLQQMAQDAQKLAGQAERLRELKAEIERVRSKRLTYREISDEVGVVERQVQRWFSGTSDFEPDSLKRLADVLDTTPDYIEYGDRQDRRLEETPDLVGAMTRDDIATRLAQIEDSQAQIIARLDKLSDHVGLLNEKDREALAHLEELMGRLGRDIGRGRPQSRGGRKTLPEADEPAA